MPSPQQRIAVVTVRSHSQELQYGSATRYKAFAFHTRAKRARNAFEIFVNAFNSRFIAVCPAFHRRLPRVRYPAIDIRLLKRNLPSRARALWPRLQVKYVA